MLENLFSPIRIGGLELPNRLVVPPMVMNYCNSDGTATDRYINYIAARAKGGWGLIVTENYAVDPRGKGFSNIPGLWNDSQIESHKKLTLAVHNEGGRVFAQIYHAGRQTSREVIGEQPVAPSKIACPVCQEMPHELSTAEIGEIVEKFGDTALRAKKAGFDGAEVHGAHGYLIAQFMSLYSNKRTDEYGGNLYNRMRFVIEVIKNIRAKVGKDYPLQFRICGDELVPSGRNIEDTKAIAMILEKVGVDSIHVSVGVYANADLITPTGKHPHGWITDYAAEVKKVASIPVITVNRINDPFLASSLIASGKADLVAMGRASLADPDLPLKVAAGMFEEIRQCIACRQGCVDKINGMNQSAGCMINPLSGNEAELAITPVETARKVFVAGGGPAGMEAAIVATRRGHDVTIYEKAGVLGGQLRRAAVPPNKGEFTYYIAWQRQQLKKLGVKVLLNTALTLGIVAQETPNAVIVATGGIAITPDIPGLDKANIVMANEVLDGTSTGQNVLFVGGGLVGAETADFLQAYGKSISIVEMTPEIARDAENVHRQFLLEDLKSNKVKMYVNSTVKEIGDACVILLKDGQEEKIAPVDTVVIAVGARPDQSLYDNLKGKVECLLLVGDAVNVRKAEQAIQEGYLAGLQV